MYQLESLRLRDLLTAQREALDFFFDEVDLESIEKIVEICLKSRGLIVLTGVGKSGIIAEKIAATLMSTGTRSLYLPAANFLHGDIGGIGSDDVVIMLSKSGKTQELLEIIPHLKKKGASLVAVVSEVGSGIATAVDQVVELPLLKELCPFDLAPTTSTAVQLLFGDLLAMSLMQEKGFTLDSYADNHPGGAIGRKITMTVRDLMKSGEDLPLCKKGDRLMDVIVELSNKRCGCLLIVKEEMGLEGVFTDGDLRRALQTEGPQALEKTMEELCTKDPIALSPDLIAHKALQLMQEKRLITVAPVIENQRVIGLIRMHDIVHEEID